jgi:hypothetical protein
VPRLKRLGVRESFLQQLLLLAHGVDCNQYWDRKG